MLPSNPSTRLKPSSGAARPTPSSEPRRSSAIRAEHERWDGTGYPDGLGGTDIPIASRIVLACDAYHAMISDRLYRKAMSNDAAIKELLTNSGSQFDPAVAEALISVIRNETDRSLPTGPART